MQSQFEIVQIFKQLKTSSLLADITLSKHQKALIPYFKSHLVNLNDIHTQEDNQKTTNNNIAWDELTPSNKNLLKQSIL